MIAAVPTIAAMAPYALVDLGGPAHRHFRHPCFGVRIHSFRRWIIGADLVGHPRLCRAVR